MQEFKTDLVITSPGRINLIGEHIDYNDGYVLPAAIDKYITFKMSVNGLDKQCRVRSKGFGEMFQIDLDSISKGPSGWKNYILGVLDGLLQKTDKLRGFDCIIESHLPIGSGVSSSAALECGLAFGLNELFGLGLNKWEIIKLSQKAEHEFVGTKCGIMDQFASVMGKKDNAILLDCKTLDFEYIPLDIEPYLILLLNTNVTHNLATGEYNIRRSQCKEGLSIVQKHFQVGTFRNVTQEMIEHCRAEMGQTIYNRCSYVVEENSRVLEAVQAIRRTDLEAFGQLLYKTHEGLSQKYEVSCPELDFLVDFSKQWKEVLGSRMMGGGFGGCTLNIVHKEAVDDYVEQIGEAYKKKFLIELSSFQTVPSQGTTKIEEAWAKN
ncbi:MULTISPECIES: galactokinase [Flavobacteriaceae]|uniref:galactokinase n=1 Tax=Flavobacteriaceae TaxID=49546 RepID=UPI0028BD54CC|nr:MULTISPECIES: galactokinase [Allomuricauda]